MCARETANIQLLPAVILHLLCCCCRLSCVYNLQLGISRLTLHITSSFIRPLMQVSFLFCLQRTVGPLETPITWHLTAKDTVLWERVAMYLPEISTRSSPSQPRTWPVDQQGWPVPSLSQCVLEVSLSNSWEAQIFRYACYQDNATRCGRAHLLPAMSSTRVADSGTHFIVHT